MKLNKHTQQVKKAFEGKSVLVTGGFGFIGGHLVKKLIEFGAFVHVVDTDTSSERKCLMNSPSFNLTEKVAHIHQADISDTDFMEKLFEKYQFNAIFNLAAYASTVEKAISSPFKTALVNALSIPVMVEALRKSNQSVDVFFHASTDKVYGELQGDSYVEDHPLDGKGLYEAAKLSADVFAQSYHRVFDLPMVVLRMCNIFGPHDMNYKNRLIPKSLWAIYGEKEPKAPVLYADSKDHSRDYLYIDDLTDSILVMSSEPKCFGQAFNSVSCTHLSTPEMIEKLVGSAVQIEKTANPVMYSKIQENGVSIHEPLNPDQVVTIKRQHLDSSKLKSLTNFEPKYTVEEGLELTAASYKEEFGEISNTPNFIKTNNLADQATVI